MSSVSFGEWIKQRRKSLDLTQQRLAQAVGCSVVLIRKIESEERRPSRQVAGLLAEALQVPSEERDRFIMVARQEKDFAQLSRIPLSQSSSAISISISRPVSLPAPATPFIGRDHELATILQLILQSECRLLTLVGPGGIGKTRLALETARSISSRYPEQFPDGVIYIPLTQLASGTHLVPVIADHIQIRLDGARQQQLQLLAYLENKNLLLVLDNFEQLLPARAAVGLQQSGIEILGQILSAAPDVKLVITSRERLNLHGEWLFELSGLPVPEMDDQIAQDLTGALQYSSINLFVQHARRVASHFSLTSDNLAQVIQICQLVDGLPLGIELAASWVRVLSAGEIATEITQSLDFLEATTRDTPARHRSLRAVFDHSWGLLTGQEQDLLSKLCVFQAGFDRQAAEQVCGASLPSLFALVDKSLIYRSDATRYELHELIHQYAGEKLEQDQDILLDTLTSHSHYYLEYLRASEVGLKSGTQKAIGEKLAQEMNNIRTAWDWAIQSQRLEDIRNSLRCLYWFYEVRGQLAEGAAAFHQAVSKLQATGAPDSLHRQVTGHCLAVEGWFAFRLGRLSQARDLLNASFTLLKSAPDPLALNEARAFGGALHYITGEYGQAIELLNQAIAYGKTAGDYWLVAQALGSLGRVAQLLGNYVEAYTLLKESLDFWDRIGDLRGRTYALAFLGNIEVNLGEYTQASRHLQMSLELGQATGDTFSVGTAWNHLGLLANKRGDYDEAIAAFERGLSLFEVLGEQASLGWLANNLGHSYLALKKFDQAGAHLQRAMQIARQAQIVPLMLDALLGWGLIRAHDETGDQVVGLLAGIARHPAGTQSIRERVQSALTSLGYSTPEQVDLAASAPDISPETIVDAALKSGPALASG